MHLTPQSILRILILCGQVRLVKSSRWEQLCSQFLDNGARDKHPNLIPEIRELLKDALNPPIPILACIENVPQAPMRADLTLYGPQVGLGPTDTLDGLWRKRIFELSFWAWGLPVPKQQPGRHYSIAGTLGCNGHFYRRKAEGKPGALSLVEGKQTMGIPICFEMNRHEIAEAVPPLYSKYIAEQALQYGCPAK